jgi:histidine triad (HIT) family protein
MSDCIFCDIVARKLPATILHDDGAVLAIRDVNPQAPVHVLVLPHEHIESAAALTAAHDGLWAQILHVAQAMARNDGIEQSGYRLVTSIGHDGGQTVPHLHVHVLGGRHMGWPPG